MRKNEIRLWRMKCVPHEMCRRLACGTLILEAGEFHTTMPKASFHEAIASFHVVREAVQHFMTFYRHFIKKSFHARSAFHFSGGFMSENLVLDLSMQFAIDIVNLCESLKGKSILTNQLLRSGTSIGANIHEANYASSKADFVAKMQIALKECHETEYWLKLFVKTNIISENIYSKLSNDSGKIRRILIASINTAKGNS